MKIREKYENIRKRVRPTKHSSCLYEVLYPCIGLAKEEFRWGNIKEGLFSVYRDGKHEEYWEMSNESDTECSSCAERLMCKNCKAYKILYTNQKNICEYKK